MERPVSLELELETPTFYTWEVPGKPVSVRLDFDVVDRILAEVMQGFGAVPKRGAEVGGLLLGTITGDQEFVVHVRDFEPVVCEHARGPSYLLSEADRERLAAALERVRRKRSSGRETRVVGFCRSHTRDGLGLGEEDLALFDEHFREPGQVFLLVKPFATRTSVGAFFFREQEEIRGESSYLEFPFRRKELGGGSAAAERPEAPAPPAAIPSASRAETTEITFQEAGEPVPPPSFSLLDDATPAGPPPAEASPKLKRNPWIPLSFVFLLVGVLLGFQAAISFRPAGLSSPAREPYALSLVAEKSGSTINLRWDRQAPIILKARSGLLTITDGSYTKSLELDPSQLQNETVIYHFLTSHVKFRLEVLSQDRTSIAEVIEVHTDGPPAAPAGDTGAGKTTP
jgi:hypothetical protein